MSPRFSFTIDEIGEAPDAPVNVDALGNWIPSIVPGANRRVSGGVSGRWWYCDTQRIRETQPLDPTAHRIYKRFSVYFGGGYGIWVLQGDATSPSAEATWFPLRFDHLDDYSSFLTNAGQNPTLRVQRSDQTWPSMLLPDIYHAPVHPIGQNYGGLTGELPIFLALIALSMPREALYTTLPQMFIGGSWRLHNYRSPRTNQRGVVVTVYLSGGSTAAELEQYEHGYLGKYYN